MTTPSSIPTQEVYFPGANFIYGMRMVWVSNTTLTVSQGYCRDSTNSDNISLYLPPNNDQSLNLQPFTLNSAVSGAGGLDVGTVADSTFYYVFAIASSTNSQINNDNSPQQSLAVPPFTTPDPTAPIVQDGYYTQATVLMSKSLVPTLPLNYDMYRRIGCVATDSSGYFRKFMQWGWGNNRTMVYDPGTGATTTGIAIPSSPTTGSSTFINVGVLTTLVPQIDVECLFDVSIIGSSAGDAIYMSPATIDNGTTATVGAFTNASTVAGTYAQLAQLRCPVSLPNATQQSGLTIGNVVTALVATTTTDAIVIKLSGYVDAL